MRIAVKEDENAHKDIRAVKSHRATCKLFSADSGLTTTDRDRGPVADAVAGADAVDAERENQRIQVAIEASEGLKEQWCRICWKVWAR